MAPELPCETSFAVHEPSVSHSSRAPMSVETMRPLPPLACCTVAVIGLGYVGLPLAVEFGKPQACVRTGVALRRRVLGFDVNEQRLAELRTGHDRTRELSPQELAAASLLELSSDPAVLAEADVFVVTVPTPIDAAKRPDLTPLEKASRTVGEALRLRITQRPEAPLPLVIYESTVYPGATEEVCVPILEHFSGQRFNEGFACGYSPERINPGDSEHKFTTITKVTSGSTDAAKDWVDDFYGSVVQAGTYPAASLKVAEAAKVIENTQRDLNIALVNELAIIFRTLGIDTLDVLEAAGTKWNFLPFRPGLVGGHCIGVDPYYLTYKSELEGYHPYLVLAGRRINDSMGRWVVEQLVLEMARRQRPIGGARVLVLGLTFKENCPDLRNTRVIDLLASLGHYGMLAQVMDPWADPVEAQQEYALPLRQDLPADERFDVVIVAVAHHQFVAIPSDHWLQMLEGGGLIVDLKGIVPRAIGAIRL